MKILHNTPIKLKTDYRFRKSDDVITTIIDTKRRIQTTEKPETTYFIWFLSLKLLLEMEKLGLGLQKRKEVLIIGKDIKIDKNYYKEWDLNEVLKLPFHKWWKTHKNLFEVPCFWDKFFLTQRASCRWFSFKCKRWWQPSLMATSVLVSCPPGSLCPYSARNGRNCRSHC